jgi:hypothetical protein
MTDLMFAKPPVKPTETGATARPPAAGAEKAKEKTPCVVLDMGEASREEGFRLYGCR